MQMKHDIHRLYRYTSIHTQRGRRREREYTSIADMATDGDEEIE